MFTHSKKFIKQNYFLLFIGIFLLYSLVLIYRSSFVIDGVRYFSLFDDEMISMRYAYNLAQGNELVWNTVGERVEGFTNPLWTLYMAFIHLFPITHEKISLVIQLTSVALFAGTLWYIKKITEILTRHSLFANIVALLFTAFYFPLNNWVTIQGSEVSLLAFLLTTSVYYVILTKHFYRVFLLLGIGTLTRLDFLLPALVLISVWFLQEKNLRKVIMFRGLPVLFTFILIQFGARYWYYGEILPNTYYLKMTGYPLASRIIRGVYVTLQEIHLLILAIPFLYLFFSKNKRITLLLGLFITQLIYSMYVGGDAWEFFGGANRYVAVAMPLFFIALASSLNTFRLTVKKYQSTNFRKYKVAEYAVLVLFFLILNTTSDNALLYLTTVKKVPTIEENAAQVRMAKSINTITEEDVKIAVVQAGVLPYFSPDRQYIDLLGKSDKIIASTTAYRPKVAGSLRKHLLYRPGHMKWNYQYVVNELKPDIFAQVWPESEKNFLTEKYKRYISDEGFEYYILK